MPSEALAKEGSIVWFVYLLESEAHPGKRYVGSTSNIERRLVGHNAGKSLHTSKFTPWRLKGYIALSSEEKAVSFERYLKSGSGHAFAKKRFW
jgi:putative endonuclease